MPVLPGGAKKGLQSKFKIQLSNQACTIRQHSRFQFWRSNQLLEISTAKRRIWHAVPYQTHSSRQGMSYRRSPFPNVRDETPRDIFPWNHKHHPLKYRTQHSFAHLLYVATMSDLRFCVLSRNRKCCIFRRSLEALALPPHRWKERQRGGKWLSVLLVNQVEMPD